MTEQLHSDRTEANTLNPLLLDQLAWIFAQAALDNFLQQQLADAPPDSPAIQPGSQRTSAICEGGEIDGQAR